MKLCRSGISFRMTRKGDYIQEQIVTGQICPYCGRNTVLVDSVEVYGRSYGMMYLCRPCRAYVGCHQGTTRALGRLANAELRAAKHQAHEVFDRLWKERVISRHEAYRLLAEELNINPDYAHIGMLDVEQCNDVIRIFTKVYQDLKR